MGSTYSQWNGLALCKANPNTIVVIDELEKINKHNIQFEGEIVNVGTKNVSSDNFKHYSIKTKNPSILRNRTSYSRTHEHRARSPENNKTILTLETYVEDGVEKSILTELFELNRSLIDKKVGDPILLKLKTLIVDGDRKGLTDILLESGENFDSKMIDLLTQFSESIIEG